MRTASYCGARSSSIATSWLLFPDPCANMQPEGCVRGEHIEKRVELRAVVSRVWRALTDHREFGRWFRVELDGPFVAGQVSRGHITYPGYEHVQWEAVVQSIEPERLFSFTWHPYAVDAGKDYSSEKPTLVEFQ